MSDDGKTSTGSTKVLEVDDAHNTQPIILMQFVTVGGETYLVTGAGLDQRINVWRF